MARAWNKLTANFVRGGASAGAKRRWQPDLQDRGGAPRHGFSRISATARAAPWAWARCARAAGAGARAGRAGREQLARGLDPIDARKAAALKQRAARARLMTSSNAPRNITPPT